MPRPPIRKTRRLAKAAEEGRLKAEVEHEYKSVKWLADIIPFLPAKYKKNAVLWMKNLLEKHFTKIPKGIALIGLTWIIKGMIDVSEELRGKVRTYVKRVKAPFTLKFWEYAISHPTTVFDPAMINGVESKNFEGFFPDWADWLVAFTLAYIIIEHGGQIALAIGESIKSLSGLVGFLLG